MSNFIEGLNKKRARNAFRAIGRVSKYLVSECGYYPGQLDDALFACGQVGEADAEFALVSMISGKHSKSVELGDEFAIGSALEAYEHVPSRKLKHILSLFSKTQDALQTRINR